VITAPIRARSADIIDIFVYVVVLNLAVEYVPSVISEGFTLSLLTAVLLKVALEVVIFLKGRIVVRLKGAGSRWAKAGIALLLWVVAVGSSTRNVVPAPTVLVTEILPPCPRSTMSRAMARPWPEPRPPSLLV